MKYLAFAFLLFLGATSAQAAAQHMPVTGGRGPIPASVQASGVGAMDAWATQYTTGPSCPGGFTPAASVTGTGITKSAPDFTFAATISKDCVDFSSWNVEFVTDGAVMTITNAKFQCRGCKTGHMIEVGLDSGGGGASSPTVNISHCSVDMSNFREPTPEANAALQTENASVTTFSYCSMVRPPVDQLIATGTTTLILDHDYLTAFCTDVSDISDHCEAIHPHGSSVILRYVLIDARALGPIVAGITADAYFDPGAGVSMVANVGYSIFVMPTNFNWALQIGGPGSIDFTIHDSVIRKGTSGYISGAGLVPPPNTFCHDGGNNRDFDTGAIINPCL